ncbi:hypothetical protein B0H14DRAFT_3517548 [Mycena olivaceomarginata]|nr:hypothetical protein B0H14DRAFT_3517548 [Mycena olivaceomarginata]
MFDYTGDDFTFDLRALVDGTMYTDMCNTYFAMNLDVVVNNPGINMTGKDTHISVYHSITACAPVMLKQKSGVFIHVSSVGALCLKPQSDCATKAVIIAISKSIAIEYAPYMYSVVIAPLMGNTGMMQLNLGPGVEATPENIAPMLANISIRAILTSNIETDWPTDESRVRAVRCRVHVEVDGGHNI